MKQCGHCGAQNSDEQEACTGCGQALPPPATGLGGTLVMEAPHYPAAPTPPPPADPAPTAAAKSPLRGTMIGIAPPTFTPPIAPASAAATSTSQSPSQPPAARHFGATMIGMAPPKYPSPPPPPAPAGPAPSVGNPQRLSSAQKTVMGVARPGIAPLNPGQAKAIVHAAPAGTTPGIAALQGWPPAAPPSARSAPSTPRPQEPRRISLSATLSILGSAMLLVAAIVAYFMLRGHGSVTALASLDASGHEQLDLACTECPDGTKVSIDTAPVAFQAGKASLKLQKPLVVGENPIVLVLERPGRSREEIALSLPIEFRVRGSTDDLAQDAPKVTVLASVLPSTKLTVDGKPVASSPEGLVHFDYDVAADVTGPEAQVKMLERVVPYKAVGGDGVAREGRVEIRLGITPLIVDAPGASIVVDGKQIVLAGRTAPGSVLKIGAQAVALDPEGRFVSKQTLALGENAFTVRSTLKDHAPRLVSVSVRRSDNLERDGALARSMAQTSYQEVLLAPEASVGRSLGVEGQLFDLRHDGYTSVLLVDVKNGCKKGPCLAKVIYGTETTLDKGQALKAFGKMVRLVDGARSGERIPELRADLVVPGAK